MPLQSQCQGEYPPERPEERGFSCVLEARRKRRAVDSLFVESAEEEECEDSWCMEGLCAGEDAA